MQNRGGMGVVCQMSSIRNNEKEVSGQMHTDDFDLGGVLCI